MSLRLITFDLDNTLWDVEKVITRAEANLQQWLGDHAPDSLPLYRSDALASIRAQVAQQFSEHQHNLSFIRLQTIKAVLMQTGYQESQAQQLAQQAFDVFFEGRNTVEFFPGALELLERLGKNYTIFALTNGNADIHKVGLGNYLEGGYSAAQVGASKPDPAMFLAPLRLLKLDPSQAVHVGDHLVDDIQGANNAGMHSVWVNLKQEARHREAAQPSKTVTTLSDIDRVIEEISGRLS